MIEDRPENIVEIAKKIPVICYNNVYNKNISNKNIRFALLRRNISIDTLV